MYLERSSLLVVFLIRFSRNFSYSSCSIIIKSSENFDSSSSFLCCSSRICPAVYCSPKAFPDALFSSSLIWSLRAFILVRRFLPFSSLITASFIPARISAHSLRFSTRRPLFWEREQSFSRASESLPITSFADTFSSPAVTILESLSPMESSLPFPRKPPVLPVKIVFSKPSASSPKKCLPISSSLPSPATSPVAGMISCTTSLPGPFPKSL